MQEPIGKNKALPKSKAKCPVPSLMSQAGELAPHVCIPRQLNQFNTLIFKELCILAVLVRPLRYTL